MESITTPDGITVRPGVNNGLWLGDGSEERFVGAGELRRIMEKDIVLTE